MRFKIGYLAVLVSACVALHTNASEESDTLSFEQSAQQIKTIYESQLYTLPAYVEGHYGLRMFRQTLDSKYAAAEVHTPEQIILYAEKRLTGYMDESDERSRLRYTATKHMPEYLYLGVDLIGSMARADEYGLAHRQDDKLREVIRRYDFKKYATDSDMIKAWAAQLANQVYWLKQLGEQDVVNDFIQAFRRTYPDTSDKKLSPQQYGNKLYGMTHIIFADSEYYQHQVDEKQHQWIYDYFRANIDTILLRAKEDIIAEVGISFLLAGLENDPVVEKTRQAIQASINGEKGMIPSVSGEFDLRSGEHRNVLAIMLLDWQQVNAAPTVTSNPKVFSSIPYGLVANKEKAKP